MINLRMAWGAATDRGHIRAVNEDSLLASPPIFLVADGMGGHRAGDRASAIVVDEFTFHGRDSWVTPEWIVDSFQRADIKIKAGGGGGTTVAGAAVVEQNSTPYWLVFNIGDSRVYRKSDGSLSQLSVDHSVVQELVESGRVAPEATRSHPDRHVITRAVGIAERLRPDYWLFPVDEGDRLLICSDGLTADLDADQVAMIVLSIHEPQLTADELVSRALAAGGADNITAVVVDVLEVGNAAESADLGQRPQLCQEPTQPRSRLFNSDDRAETGNG